MRLNPARAGFFYAARRHSSIGGGARTASARASISASLCFRECLGTAARLSKAAPLPRKPPPAACRDLVSLQLSPRDERTPVARLAPSSTFQAGGLRI